MEATTRNTARPGPEGGRSLRVFGELVTRKVAASQTGGAYSLFEVVTPPRGGPPPHVQHREDECFYVLEGEFEFLDGGETFAASAGDVIYVPKGTLHAHHNVGAKSGRLLVSLTPGGPHERFFEEVGVEEAEHGTARPDPEGPQEEAERIARIAAGYGIEVPPPLRISTVANRQGQEVQAQGSFTTKGRAGTDDKATRRRRAWK